MRSAFITGHLGFLGRHLRRHLEAQGGWQVHGVDNANSGLGALQWFEWQDVPFDLVIHAAARHPFRQAIDREPGNFPYNVMLDSALFEWALRTQQRHVVYLSSAAVYPAGLQTFGGWRTTADRGFMGDRRLSEGMAFDGDPADSYGWTKYFGERMALAAIRAGLSVTVVRPFSGYGSEQSTDFPFGAFLARTVAREDPFIIWGNADQVRDWIHVEDICAGILTLVEAQDTFIGPVNLCTGRGVSMRELAALLCTEVGYRPEVVVDREAPLGVEYRVGDPAFLHHFYKPRITLEEGVARAVRGYT